MTYRVLESTESAENCALLEAKGIYVCGMCVCPLITAASHIGITKQGYQRIHRNTGIVLNVADFPKNASFKSYGVICLPRADPAFYSFFHHEISF